MSLMKQISKILIKTWKKNVNERISYTFNICIIFLTVYGSHANVILINYEREDAYIKCTWYLLINYIFNIVPWLSIQLQRTHCSMKIALLWSQFGALEAFAWYQVTTLLCKDIGAPTTLDSL